MLIIEIHQDNRLVSWYAESQESFVTTMREVTATCDAFYNVDGEYIEYYCATTGQYIREKDYGEYGEYDYYVDYLAHDLQKLIVVDTNDVDDINYYLDHYGEDSKVGKAIIGWLHSN